ncbi:MAG TPA: cation diffusion facilitator family transporter [Thermoanaerobaculia bacterium]|nr:cation diffusion facilitator family transporter [Thermoanaerobaculia bacterium]
MPAEPAKPPKRRLSLLPRRRSAIAQRRAEEGESPRTIVIALLANIVIAAAKLVAGLVSRSSALIAEAAHSAADCVNEVFLAVGLYRDKQPPDADHPFGHGRERFLWAFMAALASFLIGGCLSMAIALSRLRSAHSVESGPLPWIVLAVAFVADGSSWLQAMRQARSQAKDYGLSVRAYIARASDPVVRAVVVEDSAALAGLVLASTGLALSTILGTSVPDSIASLLIGVLLAVTAFWLARPFADFLVGRSIPEPQLQQLYAIVESDPAVAEILALRAIYSGPEEVVVLAKIRPSTAHDTRRLGPLMDELDRKIREALPYVADVYIDVTGTSRAGGRTAS